MSLLRRSTSAAALVLICLACGSAEAPAQAVPSPAPAQTPAHGTSTPYAGDLSIFEEPGREKRLQIDRVMDILHIAPGKTVADIGAGGGWFTVRAARRVGAGGRVFAEDISPAAVKAITDRAAKERLPQVTAVLGTPADPKLPASVVDAVLLLKVYHEISDTSAFLRNLRPALAPGARIGIIDRNGNGKDHGLDRAVVEREMTAAGFHEIEHYDFTKADGQDYFLVFASK
jgi:SAM-dependent methyltransferase